jgi:glycerophosphoryl diester phosphodiesterase
VPNGLPLPELYQRTPLTLGHRGASAEAPENTLAAFGQALAQGADGFELDVTLTADGVPVVIHDDTLDRTTNGRGPVGRQTLAEIKALDAGYPERFGPKFLNERVPSLAEVLAAFGQQALINIELKHDRSPGRVLAARVVALVHDYGLSRRVILSSFQFSNLRRVRALDATLPIGLLYVSALGGARLVRWLTAGLRPEAHHPGHYTLRTDAVEWFHGHGLRVNAWTVNDEPELRRLMAAGVDGLITDHPGRAVSIRAELAASR